MQQVDPSYTAAAFRQQFPGESTEIEFKSGFGQQPIQEAAVALSNADGGVIFIGVSDAGDVLGAPLTQSSESKIHAALHDAHDPGRYALRSVNIDGVPVVALLVARREEGFSQTSDGRVLLRVGARNQPLLGADLHRLLSSRALRRFETSDTGLSTSTIEPALLEELASARDWPTDGVLDRLRERDLARGDVLTIAGALLLTDPTTSMTLRKCVVEVRRYPAEGVDYNRRIEFDGPLHHQVRNASRFVSDDLGSELIVSGLYRYDLPRLPEVVVREAIANAVAHRSYEVDRTPIVVELRPDRVVVRSPGGLPEPVTVSTIRAAQAARNPAIISALRALALTEDAGRGVDVMQDTMREALLDQPAFEDDGTSVTVTLPLSGPITSRERVWVQDLVRRGTIRPKERWVLVQAARGGTLTNAVVRDLLGITDRGEARELLQRLRDAGLLIQRGERGAARYVLAEEIAPPAAYRLGPDEIKDLIVEEATHRPIVNADVRERTGLGAVAASRLLNSLVSDGRLVAQGERRGRRYRAPTAVSL